MLGECTCGKLTVHVHHIVLVEEIHGLLQREEEGGVATTSAPDAGSKLRVHVPTWHEKYAQHTARVSHSLAHLGNVQRHALAAPAPAEQPLPAARRPHLQRAVQVAACTAVGWRGGQRK